MRQRSILIMLAFVVGFSLYSCNDYNFTDDLQGLGKRVEALEDSSLVFFDINKSIETLKYVAETSGFVTSLIEGEDGTYTIKLKGYFNGSDVLSDSTIVLRMGVDGTELSDMLSVTKVGDTYYWVFNGELLLDDSGKPVPVKGQDGKDGKDGKDADVLPGEYVIPLMYINEDGVWMISNDGGNSWINTGQAANGKNGKEEPCTVLRYVETETTLRFLINDKGTTLWIEMAKYAED